SPQERYRRDLERPDFRRDPAQAQAVELLQALYQELVVEWQSDQTRNILARWLRQLRASTEQKQIQGLYFWGGVGRGKTYLMDNFYESLPFKRKMRVHFHRFMRRIHAEL